MKSCSVNDVKIYNLSSGKSLPEWLSEKKKRSLQKNSLDFRKRIELIQDFDMPGVSSNIQISPDGNYIVSTGIYKPRMRCYDVKNLSMKFERCFDSEILKFKFLSEDYSKIAFLECERFVEFHSQNGRYYRLRIPKFGKDLAYHTPSCELFVVGSTHEVYRLNLELGRFMIPWETDATAINCCLINPIHYLTTFGTEEGKVEGWDPRSGKRASVLDAALNTFTENSDVEGLPSVTSLAYKDGLTLGVGTSTGQILLYDIRSSKPLLIKDHYYSLPIKDIEFHKEENMVFSMDSKIVKIWDEQTGNPYTSVESEVEFNDLCLIPNTGMFFIANEDKKIQTYYIPTLGPAPRWCSFLDSLTEELEETDIQTIYDDYKFVTERELNALGLGHLLGTNLLRAYMHGYFMDMRLYRKVKSTMQPFEFGEFKKKKIREKIEEGRTNRLRFNNLPKVNKEIAIKLMNRSEAEKKKAKSNILDDDRFKDLFKNPDFEIDKNADEFKLLNPVISKIDRQRSKKLQSLFTPVDNDDDEMEGKESTDDDSSSDDDKEWVKEMREAKRKINRDKMAADAQATLLPKFYEIKSDQDFRVSDLDSRKNNNRRLLKSSFEDRIRVEDSSKFRSRGPLGEREMSFKLRQGRKDFSKDQAIKHHQERKKIRRSAGGLKNRKKSWTK